MEIPLFLCWPNGDDIALYEYIKELRKKFRYSYSDEFIYDCCLTLLHATEKDKKYFKLSKICKESVDEYIRKMRMTGLLSLRGNGRFLDANKFKKDKIDYIIENYPTEKEFAKKYTKEDILTELLLISVNKKESKDPIFRFINAPARLEFLTSIALKQWFEEMDVNPQYPYDDEGLPTSTAGGGIADIVCHELGHDELVEVTLMRGRSDQVNNEIIPIARHQREAKKQNPNTFSIFLAPVIHEDTIEAAAWQKHRSNIDIYEFDIPKFIGLLKSDKKRLYELVQA